MNANDIKALRRKHVTWPQMASMYGVSYHDMKTFAVEHGLAKRLPPKRKAVRVPRCSKPQAVAMADRLGIQYKTVLARVYALPNMTLDEVEADIAMRQKKPRCSREEAKAIGQRVGLSEHTIMTYVYRWPDKSLAEIEAMLGVRK